MKEDVKAMVEMESNHEPQEKKEKKVSKPCVTCKFVKAMPDKNPCTHCYGQSKWKPMTEKQSIARKAKDNMVEKLVDEKLAKKTKKKESNKPMPRY